jgi:hypothetical protein
MKTTQLANIKTPEESSGYRTSLSTERRHIYSEWRPALRFNLSSASLTYEGKAIGELELANFIAEQSPQFSHQRIKFALEGVLRDMRDEFIQSLRKQICERPVIADTGLREWVSRMQAADTTPEAHEAHVTAMKHFIWSVKQQIMGRGRVWCFMPILYGEGGGGKSHNLRALMTPVTDAWREAELDIFDEKFEGENMARNFVIVFQELTTRKQGKVSPDLLKSWVDKSVVQERGAYAKGAVPKPMITTFIATTNRKPPFGIIDSSTGVRRWYGIRCTGADCGPGTDRKKWFDAFDVWQVWDCVDVNSEPPLLVDGGIHPTIKTWQETYMRTPSDFERFISTRYELDENFEIEEIDMKRDFRLFLEESYGHRKTVPFVGEYRKLLEELQIPGISGSSHGRVFKIKGLRPVDDGEKNSHF